MNKTMLCFELLRLLNTKNILNKNELAELLEVNPRNIIEYVKTLQDCGYDIESVRGIYGGYHLNKNSLMPTVRLTEAEINTLRASCNFLEHQKDFLAFKEYLKAISKVIALNDMDYIDNDLMIIEKYPLIMPRTEILKRYETFKVAIANKKKCNILYQSGYNKDKSHIIHPYKVFIYSDSWFVLAWNETVNNYGYFRLNRIKEIKLLPESFTVALTYNEHDFIDEFGMRHDGRYYDIKLELTDLYTVISERQYGKNQRIERIDEHKTILECQMQNKFMIKTFVLGFGSKVKVLEPEWLKEEIRKEAEAILTKI